MITTRKLHKVTIMRESRASDSMGGGTITTTQIGNDSWAAVIDMRGLPQFAAERAQLNASCLVIIAYRPDLNPLTDYVNFNGRRLNIASVNDILNTKRELRLACSEVVLQNVSTSP